MTVHIREFVLRLGVDSQDDRSGQADRSDVTQEDLNELHQELMRELRALAGGTRAQPFDR